MKWLYLFLLFIACNPPQEEVKYWPIETAILNEREIQLVGLINRYRDSLGLPILRVEMLASELAKEHVEYMTVNDTLTHDYFQTRFDRSGAEFASEIIAQNYLQPRSLLNGYLGSPPHKEALDNPKYQWIGISWVGDFNCCLLLDY